MMLINEKVYIITIVQQKIIYCSLKLHVLYTNKIFALNIIPIATLNWLIIYSSYNFMILEYNRPNKNQRCL